MAEALKNVYSREFLEDLGGRVAAVYSEFDVEGFVGEVLDHRWDELALKARIRHIVLVLTRFLPADYVEAVGIVRETASGCEGFPYLLFPDFVEVNGQREEHWELSMEALEDLTKCSSAEFAVRPFILRDPERMIRQMKEWALNDNEHVRRLASEGCRPRLPWGQALQVFKEDPKPVLEVLELLKEDSSLYVRKSVANNLNDIAKDHPNLVIQVAYKWHDRHPHTDWIVRHGCRTLIKQSHPAVMKLFGYASDEISAVVEHATLTASEESVQIGGEIELAYELIVRDGEEMKVRIDYTIDFVKSRGTTSMKAFKLVDKVVAGGSQLAGTRVHRWADLTTRKHYPGIHRIALRVNGVEVAETDVTIR